MYSAFRWLSPAVRSSGTERCSTSAGAGKWGGPRWLEDAGNREMNLFLMLVAAAPLTCWAIMPLARLRKGSRGSERPVGEKMAQWWALIVGASFEEKCTASMARRWAVASARRVEVVVVGAAAGGGLLGESLVSSNVE